MTSISPDVQRVLDLAYGSEKAESRNVDMAQLENPHRPFSFGYVVIQLAIAAAGVMVAYSGGYGIQNWAIASISFLFGLSCFVHYSRKSMEPRPVNWIGPDTVFLFPFALFHFGYVVPYLFVDNLELSERVFYGEEYFNFSLMHCLNCSVAFLIGYELWKLRRGPSMTYSQPEVPSNLVSVIGAVIVVVAFLFQWVCIMAFGFSNATASYTALSEGASESGNRLYGISFFVGTMGIAMYCVCSCLRKRRLFGNIALGLVIAAGSLFVLLLGDRGGFVYLAGPACLAFYYFVRQIRIIFLAAALVVTLFFFSVLSSARDETTLDVGKMMAIAEERAADDDLGHFLRLFLEAGSSISTVGISIGLMESGSEEFWYGESYWLGFETLVPNITGGLRSSDDGGKGTPAQWLTTIGKERGLTQGAGMGSSIAMEAYINFGLWFGPLVLLVVGLMYRGMYERVLCKPTVVSATTLFVSVTMLLLWTRNSSSYVIRYIIWTFLFVYVVSAIFGNKQKAGT